MKVKYPGPLSAVTVEALPGSRVAAGETINVPAVIGKALLLQGWLRAGTKPKVEKEVS